MGRTVFLRKAEGDDPVFTSGIVVGSWQGTDGGGVLDLISNG